MDNIKTPDAKTSLTNDFQIVNLAELCCRKCFGFGIVKGETEECKCCGGSGHIDDCECNVDENQLLLFEKK